MRQISSPGFSPHPAHAGSFSAAALRAALSSADPTFAIFESSSETPSFSHFFLPSSKPDMLEKRERRGKRAQ